MKFITLYKVEPSIFSSLYVCALCEAIISMAEQNCANRELIIILLVFMLAKGLSMIFIINYKIMIAEIKSPLSWLLVLNTTTMIAYKIFIAIRLIVNHLFLYL
jgi:hypothetical protein